MAPVPQEAGRPQAPPSASANQNEPVVTLQVDTLRHQRGQRQKLCLRHVTLLELARLPHVNDRQLVAVAQPLPQVPGGHSRNLPAQEFNAARENRINLTRNTVTSARSLYMTVVSDASRVAARRQAVISSNSALDATQAGYEVGTRNVVDVLNAQNTLFAAQRDYYNSRYDYIINLLRLKEQAGLLSPEDVIVLDSYLNPPPPPTASASK